jgi:putative transcriptional regulator
VKEELFEELVASIREAGAVRRGEKKPSRVFKVEKPDIKAIRGAMGLTQMQFAALLGISVNTLRNWEQGRREPEGPARVLLLVAAHRPDAILESVKSQVTVSQK